jgi:hypothetical protein
MLPSVTTTILPNLDGVGGSCRKSYRYSATLYKALLTRIKAVILEIEDAEALDVENEP